MNEIYSVGDKCMSGEEIVNIYGQTRTIVIFGTVKEGKKGIRWEIQNIPDFGHAVFRVYHRIHNSIPSSVSEESRWDLNQQLAAVLFNALTSKNKEDALNSFEHIDKKVNNLRTPNQTRLYFFGFVISAASIISMILVLLLKELGSINNQIILCGICGIIGAVISTLQRARDFEIADDEKIIFIVFQATVIVVLGLLSGITIYIVSNSDIAFSFAKNNTYNLMTVSLMAGFAERAIPDLFKQISK